MVFAVRREIVRGEVGVVQFSDKRAFVVVAANMESLDRQTLLEVSQRTSGPAGNLFFPPWSAQRLVNRVGRPNGL